jgi:2,4-dienoyl-CoA reductase-like NADH-dependent reductase (Old Yellow Enzyme family)
VGDDYPVTIKMNCADNMAGGLEIAEGVRIAAALSRAGMDAIEVSAGNSASGRIGPVRTKIDTPEKEAWNLAYAIKVKAAVECPVMVVGGFRSHAICTSAVADAGMDYIALSRPLIREPNLPRRWHDGDRRPAACISCNGCFKPGIEAGGIACVVKTAA